MYFLEFYYLALYKIYMAKEDDELSNLNDAANQLVFKIALFISWLFLFSLLKLDFWHYIESNWPQEFRSSNKYNIFAPSALLFFLCWFLCRKLLKKYFLGKSIEDLVNRKFIHTKKPNFKINYLRWGLFLYFSIMAILVLSIPTLILYGWKGLFPVFIAFIALDILIYFCFCWPKGT